MAVAAVAVAAVARGGRGGHGGLLGGLLPLAEVFGGYEAYKSAAEEDLAIRNSLIEGLHILPGTAGVQRRFPADAHDRI